MEINKKGKLREWLREVIFEAETPVGKFFDIALLLLILVSVAAVMLETVTVYDEDYHELFVLLEWTLTILFTIGGFKYLAQHVKNKDYPLLVKISS